jgi:hypothetical protein
VIENYPAGKRELRGGKRKHAGRPAMGRVSVMVRLHPDTKSWLDARQPIPRGHVIDELVKIAKEEIAEEVS